MHPFRFSLLALAAATLTFGSCQKNDPTPAPTTTVAPTQQLTTGSWRLDQIKEGGQVTSAGTAIKDRYSLTFRADGTYTQKLLADNTTTPGTWMLMTNDTKLHLVDHKGESNEYTLATVSATELRYTFVNRTGATEERTFSAQP